jgi:hypothetical protein
VEEKVRIAPPWQNPPLKKIVEPDCQPMRACCKRSWEIKVETEVLTVKPGAGAAVDPDISDPIETLTPETPEPRASR